MVAMAAQQYACTQIPVNHTLKNGYDGKYVMCTLPQFRKKKACIHSYLLKYLFSNKKQALNFGGSLFSIYRNNHEMKDYHFAVFP